MIPQFTLGDRLAKARETAGISVQDMADRLGVSRTTVSNYEHERTEPNRATLRAWEAETRVPMWWLVNGGDEPSEAAVDRRRRRAVTQREQASRNLEWLRVAA
jgi:transcriptional regulator with XRE-family HTH domain